MEDESRVARLVNQLRANDIDARVDAITKLQAEFEAGTEIPDHDALLAALKTCLRTPNQHLTTATLNALPPVLPLLTARAHAAPGPGPAPASSPAARERAREKAREVLVVLGGLAFRSSAGGAALGRSRDGKGGETPLAAFEKALREQGLASKVWRVREQAILTLVHVRRAHHMFPMRPYLPALVEALEDTDGTVRECARQSVVELFTGPGVTDAARADLKKEMARKGVRKTIVDGVLAKVLAGGTGTSTPGTLSESGSDNGDSGQKEYVPPSIALMNRRPGTAVGSSTPAALPRTVSQGSVRELTRPASRAAAVVSPPPTESMLAAGGGGTDVKAVYIASAHDLENEFANMLRHFEGKETEHNWAPREQAIQRVRGMLKGEVHERYADTFMSALKNSFNTASLKTLTSLRTTVAVNTCLLYSELAIALGSAIDPFCDLLLTNLLRMGSLTKKITAQQSQAAVTTILTHASAQPRIILPMLWNSLQDKSIPMRTYAMGHLQMYMEVHGLRSKHAIEVAGGADTLERSLKKSLGDPNPGVKECARKMFWVFDAVWPERGRALLDTLDATSKKQIEKFCPNPGALAAIPAPTPKPKKSSVAAAIAASRAKAKAIATAPPTLRHQATSTSHAARAMSPTSGRRPASPAFSTSSSSGGMRAGSPVSHSPPRARVLSHSVPRAASPVLPIARTRSASGQLPPASPPSPTHVTDSTFRRRISSPLVTPSTSPSSSTTLRRAVQTALPASPPYSASAFSTPTPKTSRPGSSAIHLQRESLSLAAFGGLSGPDEQSLLLATQIPIPEDSDTEMDESVNLISFPAPFEADPPAPRANSQAASVSPKSSSSKAGLSNALSPPTASPPSGIPQPIIEDALRARAEQAESAAERLLELVDPEEDSVHPSPIPPSLLLRNPGVTPKTISKVTAASSNARATLAPPQTPKNRKSAIMQQAVLFQDSPARNGKPASSVFDMVGGTDNATEWWRKRTSRETSRAHDGADPVLELQTFIVALEQGSADVPELKSLALLSRQYPVDEPGSPLSPAFAAPPTRSLFFEVPRSVPSSASNLWKEDKNIDRLFSALIKFLDPRKDAELLEYGLIVLWELLANQTALLDGREADVFTILLGIRYSARPTVMQATNMFRDLLAGRVEPVYGLTTLHACLRTFRDEPLPPSSSIETKDGTYAFGLIAMGKFVLRLPAEVLEEELPRLRATLISALTDNSNTTSLIVREAAAASIIAAQLVLRDETHLFALLDGLPDDKKNLLTYLFDKHGSRGNGALGPSSVEKLEREMRRLDNRTNTPPRTKNFSVAA
ncbi:hypothetical protein WOLCODRAFT_89263 [Wolfiporia cocos MD-104 SS10]|uniref:TOG domain-containing protein n=1 Tax=Wolfiporia cocos (strain MD-104) TaxID=742152 RepID=A0A2H3JRK6_WOLCO|nr:hypothetical protein WOLCODRAFT_89263 [Wolfiporia cocos MD-104 SS10]